MAKDKRFSGLPAIETERLLLRALEMGMQKIYLNGFQTHR